MNKKLLIPIISGLFCWMALNLQSCKEADPCEEVTCQRGNCVEGTCDCPTGYEGVQCETEKEPSKIEITAISVNTWPEDDNGTPWDEEDAPDLFVTFGEAGGDEIFPGKEFYENVEPGFPYHFNVSIDVTDLTKTYYVNLEDWDDLNPNPQMGEVEFNLWDLLKGKDFPEETEVLVDGDTKIVLSVEYEF